MSKAGRNYLMYLEDILMAIRKIEKYTRNLNFKVFSSDEMIIDAVLSQRLKIKSKDNRLKVRGYRGIKV